MENLELRYATELRANSDTGIITGTAIVFNSESELLGGEFREKIMPSAATEDFLKTQDIVMKYQHGDDSILARYSPKNTRNSLKFSVDERGVNFEFKAKKKDMWIIDSINDGDLNACSFAFRVSPDDGSENWEQRFDGTYLRTINKFDKVADFSIVITPAYSETSCNTRGLDELKAAEEAKLQQVQREQEVKEIEEQVKQKFEEVNEKIINYYKKYEDILSTLKK
jgi:HK97 family phage prohead protease